MTLPESGPQLTALLRAPRCESIVAYPLVSAPSPVLPGHVQMDSFAAEVPKMTSAIGRDGW